MKQKRFLSILLAALMVVSTLVFSGCTTDEDGIKAASTSTRDIVALNMYILTEDETDIEATKKVQKAMNEILLPNHKTLLKINYLKEDEYWDAVDAALDETEELLSTTLESAKVVGTEKLGFAETIEYIFNDETTDIELTQPQIDIFVVNDYEKYIQLQEDGYLKGLNEYISYDSKILSTNIYPTLMTSAKIGNETYGIPTNIGVEHGDYTYLVFNNDLLEQYGYQVKDLTRLTNNKLASYLAEVKAGNPDIWPLSEPFGVAGAEFYNDELAFIAVAGQFNYMASGATPAFVTSEYTTNLLKAQEFRNLGYCPETVDENAKYAVKVEKSPLLLDGEGEKKWTDEDGTTYVRYLFDIPRVTIEDCFTSVMCVSATSPVPERAMEMITLFQTNSELANLLQFGIEDVHYQIDERDGSIVFVNNEDDMYVMDNLVTGNTYIKYSPDNDKEFFEKAKDSNLGAAPSGFLGVNYDFESATELSQYECAKAILVSAHEAIENGADVQAVINTTSRELEKLGCTRESATADYGGIFGTVQSMQRQQGQVIAKTFAISEDILKYNEDYGVVLQRKPVVEETAEGEAAEGETVEGEVAEGEAVEGETVEGEVAEGEAVEGETVEGEAVEGEAVEGEETAEETTEEAVEEASEEASEEVTEEASEEASEEAAE